MRALLIDNYDSFTWNLAQYIAQANGVEPIVVKNDAFSWTELMRMGPFDCIILSPGPGTVLRASDFGVSRHAIERSQVPLLGVCLGHQGIAHVHGGRIVHAPEPVHGRMSAVVHNGDPLFKDIPSPFQVVRYHSLVAARPLPKELVEIARTECGQVMGLRHETRPLWGVQFHPESILTERGHQLMRNFRDIAQEARHRKWVPVSQPSTAMAVANGHSRSVHFAQLDTPLDAEDLFCGLYGNEANAFWLDSARVTEGLSRYSFLGKAGSEGVRLFDIDGDSAGFKREGEEFMNGLERAIDYTTEGGDALPFTFRGGWVGYFGYEMKALFGAAAAHVNPYPDAGWMHADRFIAVDHLTGAKWAVAIEKSGESGVAQEWLTQLQREVGGLAPVAPPQHMNRGDAVALEIEQERAEYLQAIQACKRAIRDGECYQVCLTNRLRLQEEVDGLQLYRVLRECNPAPFSAYLRFGELEVISASPERFLQVDRERRIETKPIKGTARRDEHPGRDHALAEELRLSDKNRAENLMIVDLMRNDLSQVADTGSVQVPRLMYIESYANVHQLLSTVQARLRDDCSLIDLVRATFPGGSITGAPKLRAMQIIDELERSARGIYCGAIGYLGYDCVMDLNIAIRTIVSYGGEISFGAGGGITQLSDAADEFEEIMLKAAGLIKGLTSYQGAAKTPRPHSVRKANRPPALTPPARDPVLSFTLGSEECAAG